MIMITIIITSISMFASISIIKIIIVISVYQC